VADDFEMRLEAFLADKVGLDDRTLQNVITAADSLFAERFAECGDPVVRARSAETRLMPPPASL
jgi:hypothetical protein